MAQNVAGPIGTNTVISINNVQTLLYHNVSNCENRISFSVGFTTSLALTATQFLIGVTANVSIVGKVDLILDFSLNEGQNFSQAISLTPTGIVTSRIFTVNNLNQLYIRALSTSLEDFGKPINITFNSFVV